MYIIREIKNAPSGLLSYISAREFLRTREKCGEEAPAEGDHRKLILEETKVIIYCLNCTEMIRSSLLIAQRENAVVIRSNERLIS